MICVEMVDSLSLHAPPPLYPLPDQHADIQYSYGLIKVETEVCAGCECPIYDRWLLRVNDRSWHLTCLRCTSCCVELDQLPSCYMKHDQIYCKHCYIRQFGAKCAHCGRMIQPTDWVRRARSLVYHLACFACDACKRQLSTGEEFALQECRLLCKQHFIELMDGDSGKATHKQKCKRVRTTFTEEQLQVLQANFHIDSNPDGQDLERIAQITGLSKRVTQVWFQNSRARQKKYQGIKQKQGQSSSCPDTVSGDCLSVSMESSMNGDDIMDMEQCSDSDRQDLFEGNDFDCDNGELN